MYKYNITSYFHKTTGGNFINMGKYQFMPDNLTYNDILELSIFLSEESKSIEDIQLFMKKKYK